MLSRGGATEELVNLIDPVKGKGITLVTVTRDSNSPLAKVSDLVLHLDTDESDCRGVLPTASILAIIAIFDAVADELTGYSQFTKKAFYLNHNHGAVGAWLKEDLDDGQEVS
jgi:arabinose-5-phosphate isomerase